MTASIDTDHRTSSNGRVKIPWGVLQWLLALAFAAGGLVMASKMETEEHADKTYLRKDVWEQKRKEDDRRWEDIREFMKEIRDELKQKEDRRQ